MRLDSYPDAYAGTGCLRSNRRRILPSDRQAHEPRELASRLAALLRVAPERRGKRVTIRGAAGGGGGVRGDGGERGVAARARAVPAQGAGRRGRR
jgi:hypothetical protein